MSPVEQLHKLTVNVKSPAYRRAKLAGFTIGNIRVKEEFGLRIELYADFRCVCGRQETLMRALPYDSRFLKHMLQEPEFCNGWDVAQELENFGSFSVEHLRRDGYSDEQIKEIRYIYDLEEEVKSLRRIKRQFDMMNGNIYLERSA